MITRFLKGAAAAFTAPASLSIITTTFAEGPARNRALAIYTACGASGFSLGLVFGGLLTELGWRWTFLLPVPIALALLVAAPRVLAKDAPAEGPRRGFDFAGAATITAAMLLLVRTVVEAPEAGWGAARDGRRLRRRGAAARGLRRDRAALGAPARAARHPALGHARQGQPRAWRPCSAPTSPSSSSARCTCSRCSAGRRSRPRSRSCPGGLLVAFGAPRIGPLVDRFGTARIILVGAISFVVGYALFLRIGESLTYAAVFLPSMILIGVGFALCFPTLNIQATAGVANHEQGLASGLVNTSFQVGGAIGLAIVTAVVSANTSGTDAASMLDGFRPGIAVVTAIAALGLAVAVAGVLRESRDRAPRGRRGAPGARGRARTQRTAATGIITPVAAVDAVETYLGGLPALRARRLAHGEWGLTDPRRGARRRAARRGPADRGRPAARRRPCRSTRADELDPWMLLWWNRQTRMVRFGCSRVARHLDPRRRAGARGGRARARPAARAGGRGACRGGAERLARRRLRPTATPPADAP